MMAAIVLAAYLEGIDPKLLEAICYVETGLHNERATRLDGRSFSYGICQLKSNTARDVGFLGEDNLLNNYWVNARFAAKYIRYLFKRYDNNIEHVIRAYNCGHIYGNCGKKYYKKVVERWKSMKN